MSHDTPDPLVLRELRTRFPTGGGTQADGQADGQDAAAVEGLVELCRAAREVTGASLVEAVLDLDGRELVLASSGAAPTSAPGAGAEVREPFRVAGAGQCGALRLLDVGSTNDRVVPALAAAAGRTIDLEVARGRVFDLSEREARAQEALVEAAGQLVHDLNNPLAAAAMSLEIARDEVADGLVAQLLDRAVSSTNRMKRIVTDLLALSSAPRRGHAELGTVLGPLVEVLDGSGTGGVEHLGRVETVGTDVVVPLDADVLEVVLFALLENAVKFARPEEPVRVRVAARPDGGQVRLEVSDAGRGIAPEDRERVLLPTARLDRRIPGTGMGLTAVRRLVQAADGTVELTDSPWGGTTVVLTFPSASQPPTGTS